MEARTRACVLDLLARIEAGVQFRLHTGGVNVCVEAGKFTTIFTESVSGRDALGVVAALVSAGKRMPHEVEWPEGAEKLKSVSWKVCRRLFFLKKGSGYCFDRLAGL